MPSTDSFGDIYSETKEVDELPRCLEVVEWIAARKQTPIRKKPGLYTTTDTGRVSKTCMCTHWNEKSTDGVEFVDNTAWDVPSSWGNAWHYKEVTDKGPCEDVNGSACKGSDSKQFVFGPYEDSFCLTEEDNPVTTILLVSCNDKIERMIEGPLGDLELSQLEASCVPR